MTHLICDAATSVADTLKTVRDLNPAFMTNPDKAHALQTLRAVAAQVDELRLRVLAETTDLATADGASTIAAWAGVHLNQTAETARVEAKLANALTHLPQLQAAFSDGRLSTDHARAVIYSLEQLPHDTSPEVMARAETVLIDYCETYDPKQVRRLGRAILHTVDPEGADEAEHRKLLDLEKHALEKTRLTMRSQGDGTTRISARVPDHAAARLATYLNSWSNPRKAADTELLKAHDGLRPWLAQLPAPRRAGEAFISYLEAADPNRMPIHGGAATTLVVTIDADKLLNDTGSATLLADLPGENTDTISVSQARRLACNAGILPMILNGKSEVLDLGRTKRFFSPAQRTAMAIQWETCLAEGCDIPATWCEAHHFTPWATGGNTNLNDGGPLCSRHHHLQHDPTYTHQRQPNGRIQYTRRC